MVSLPSGRDQWIRVRIMLLVIVMMAGAAAVAHGAWQLGVTRAQELTDLAAEQYTRKIKISAHRGMITDRHGEELAVEIEVKSVYADPRKVTNPQLVAATLSPLLGKDAAKMESRLGSDRHFVWLKRRVSPQVAQAVEKLGFSGVSLLDESKRFYPNRSLGSHIIGFAGLDSNGLEGVELRFDGVLQGNAEAATGLSDARGRMVFSDGIFGSDGIVGRNVELTIDRTLQYIVEQELLNTIRVFEARAGHIVMMDPSTGEILALANYPTYNPNRLNESTAENRRNRAVLDVFEPGSTFKVFTLAAALNAGKLRPNQKTFCERGRMEMFDVVIHDDHRDGWLNPTECLKRSSNICFAKIAAGLSKKRLYHYIRRFGFGERTHIQLPFEMRGTLNHHKKWYDIDTATTSFGQGIGVTGIQMATALSAIANGGKLMKPLIVRRVIGQNGETERSFSPQVRRRVISRYTARMVADMMTAVTEEGGTGTRASLNGYLVAGKTGTAQKSEGSKGYAKDKWVASFFGFVPSDRPRLAISIVIDEPLINHYGGTVAAPVFKRIADQSLRYLGVSPRFSGKSGASRKKENVKKAKVERSKRQDPGNGSRNEELGPPSVFADMLEMGPGQVRTPHLIGMSMSDAMEVLSSEGLRPMFMGTGIAAEQIPQPDEPVDTGEFVQVNFMPLPDHGTLSEEDADTGADSQSVP